MNNESIIEAQLRAIGDRGDALPFETPTIEQLHGRNLQRSRKRAAILAVPTLGVLFAAGILTMKLDIPPAASETAIVPETRHIEIQSPSKTGGDPVMISLANHKPSPLKAFHSVQTTIPLLVIDKESKRQQWTWMVYETKQSIDLDELTDTEREAAFRVMDHKPEDRLYEL